MKVGIVSQYWYDRGGTEVLARQLTEEFTRQGDTAELLFFDVANRPSVDRPGMPGTVVPITRWQPAIEALDRWGADELIVMLDLRSVLVGHIGGYRGRFRTTLIVNVNNADFDELRRSPQLAQLCRDCILRFDRVAVLFATSPAARLLGQWGVPYGLARIGIPPVGALRPADFRQRHGIAASESVLLCVGLVAPLKHQVELLQLLPEVPGRRVVFIGDIYTGTPEYGSAFCDAVLRRKDCLWLDGLPRDEVLEAMAASDLLVFPSQSEGAGLVLIEAMAVNLPWVCTPAVDLAAELQGGVVTSLAGMAATISELLADTDGRRALGAAGRTAQQTQWSLDAMVASLRAWFSPAGASPSVPGVTTAPWPAQVQGSTLVSRAVEAARANGAEWCVLANGPGMLDARTMAQVRALSTAAHDAVVLFRTPQPDPPTQSAIIAWMTGGVGVFAVRTAWWQAHGAAAPSGPQALDVWQTAMAAWLSDVARTYLGSVES